MCVATTAKTNISKLLFQFKTQVHFFNPKRRKPFFSKLDQERDNLIRLPPSSSCAGCQRRINLEEAPLRILINSIYSEKVKSKRERKQKKTATTTTAAIKVVATTTTREREATTRVMATTRERDSAMAAVATTAMAVATTTTITEMGTLATTTKATLTTAT